MAYVMMLLSCESGTFNGGTHGAVVEGGEGCVNASSDHNRRATSPLGCIALLMSALELDCVQVRGVAGAV